MGRIDIDMWYGDKFDQQRHRIDVFFSDIDCEYRGNIYDENGRIIGDYSTTDSVMLQKKFGVEFS